MIMDYNTARKVFLTSSTKECRKFFEENDCALELAYCDFIEDNLQGAKQKFASIQDADLRARWGLFLVNLIDEGKVYQYPSYFEIRNFLELDIQLLISHFKGDYVEKIASYSDFLCKINPETHKFIGRVFIKNDMKPQAIFFLERAKNFFYNDPELHFLFADIHQNDGFYEKSLKSLAECLKIIPEYYPAIRLKKIIEDKIFSC